MKFTWKQIGIAALGILSLVAGMTLREELTSVFARSLAAGAGVSAFSVALWSAHGLSDRR